MLLVNKHRKQLLIEIKKVQPSIYQVWKKKLIVNIKQSPNPNPNPRFWHYLKVHSIVNKKKKTFIFISGQYQLKKNIYIHIRAVSVLYQLFIIYDLEQI